MVRFILKAATILIAVFFITTSVLLIGNFGVNKIYLESTIKVSEDSKSSGGVVDTIMVNSTPVSLAYDSMNCNLYVVNRGSNDITVINSTDRVIGTIQVGSSPNNIAFDSLNGYLYVANTGSNNITVINNADKVVDSIPVGKNPDGLSFDPNNGNLYVACYSSNNVSVINDINNVIDTIPVGNTPISVAYDQFNGYIYVSNLLSNYLTVINNTNKIVDKIPVNCATKYLGYDSLNGLMYVSTSNNHVIAINSTNNIVDKIYIFDPVGITFNSINGYTYVASCHSNNITVIDNSNEVIENIPVGKYPISMTFNSENGYVYVANAVSNDISVISPNQLKYPVEFHESDLPSESEWHVTFSNGTTESTNKTSLTMYLPNGNYSYTIVSSNHTYRALQYSGRVQIAGKALQIKVQFTKITYSVKFNETGLPPGTTWYVNIGDFASGPILGSTYTISLSNGTYSFRISTVSGYDASKSSGSLIVKGNNTKEIVVFHTTPKILSIAEYIAVALFVCIVVIGLSLTILFKRK